MAALVRNGGVAVRFAAVGENWVEELIRDYQDTLTRGLYEGIAALPASARDGVMECQARACVAEFAKLYDVPATLDLDQFLARMTTGGPSKIDVRRDGDTILWSERHEGQCMCPLVKRGVVPLTPALCGCAVHWVRMLVERHARRPARVELLDAVAAGAEDCVFRITLA